MEGALEGLLIKAEVSLTCLVLGLSGKNILCGNQRALQEEEKSVGLMCSWMTLAAAYWQKYHQVEIEVKEQLIMIKDTTHNVSYIK